MHGKQPKVFEERLDDWKVELQVGTVTFADHNQAVCLPLS